MDGLQGKMSNAYQKDGEKDKFFIKPHWTRSTDEKSWWLSQMKTNDGIVFFLLGKIERRILHFWVYFVGIPQDVGNYLCTISVANPKKSKYIMYWPFRLNVRWLKFDLWSMDFLRIYFLRNEILLSWTFPVIKIRFSLSNVLIRGESNFDVQLNRVSFLKKLLLKKSIL